MKEWCEAIEWTISLDNDWTANYGLQRWLKLLILFPYQNISANIINYSWTFYLILAAFICSLRSDQRTKANHIEYFKDIGVFRVCLKFHHLPASCKFYFILRYIFRRSFRLRLQNSPCLKLNFFTFAQTWKFKRTLKLTNLSF